jgi:fructokinase
MHERQYTVVGLGELLWDAFATGKRLGGAPANFAYITNLLGDRGISASRVGRDALGDEAFIQLEQAGLSTQFVQRDERRPTGTVLVEIHSDGQARFEVAQDVAWDFLDWTAEWQKLAGEADAVCFGSLAQRSEASRETIRNFLRAAREDAVRIFDVNLRQNFYTPEIICESMRLASVVKMNHEELPVVMRLLGLRQMSEKESARRLLAEYELQVVCVTRGPGGSLLVSRDETGEHRGYTVKIADTVGSGDAFTAGLAHAFLRDKPLAEINDLANRVGAWVASQSGAMPPAPKEGLPAKLNEMLPAS